MFSKIIDKITGRAQIKELRRMNAQQAILIEKMQEARCARCIIAVEDLRDRLKCVQYQETFPISKRTWDRFKDGSCPKVDTYIALVDILCGYENCEDVQSNLRP